MRYCRWMKGRSHDRRASVKICQRSSKKVEMMKTGHCLSGHCPQQKPVLQDYYNTQYIHCVTHDLLCRLLHVTEGPKVNQKARQRDSWLCIKSSDMRPNCYLVLQIRVETSY